MLYGKWWWDSLFVITFNSLRILHNRLQRDASMIGFLARTWEWLLRFDNVNPNSATSGKFILPTNWRSLAVYLSLDPPAKDIDGQQVQFSLVRASTEDTAKICQYPDPGRIRTMATRVGGGCAIMARPKPSVTEVGEEVDPSTPCSPAISRNIISPTVTSASSVMSLWLWEADLCHCIARWDST